MYLIPLVKFAREATRESSGKIHQVICTVKYPLFLFFYRIYYCIKLSSTNIRQLPGLFDVDTDRAASVQENGHGGTTLNAPQYLLYSRTVRELEQLSHFF